MARQKILGSWKFVDMLNALLFLFIVLLGAWMLFLTEPTTAGQTYNNTSLVNTTVNITNSAPLIYAISLDNPIDLVAYNTKTVYCNVTVFDYDNQTLTVNATLFISGSVSDSAANDGNNHYSNTSCKRIGPQSQEMNYSCGFDVQYYANSSNQWKCNATVIDTGSAFSSNLSLNSTINPLVAIKIPGLLDYGDLAVNEISNDTIANITNAGNRDVNLSVEGYGSSASDGLAFVCSFGNIPLSYERYNITVNSTYTGMTQLSGATTKIPSFYVAQRTSESTESFNYTYWRVQIPVGAGGICTGKILFTASDRQS